MQKDNTCYYASGQEKQARFCLRKDQTKTENLLSTRYIKIFKSQFHAILREKQKERKSDGSHSQGHKFAMQKEYESGGSNEMQRLGLVGGAGQGCNKAGGVIAGADARRGKKVRGPRLLLARIGSSRGWAGSQDGEARRARRATRGTPGEHASRARCIHTHTDARCFAFLLARSAQSQSGVCLTAIRERVVSQFSGANCVCDERRKNGD